MALNTLKCNHLMLLPFKGLKSTRNSVKDRSNIDYHEDILYGGIQLMPARSAVECYTSNCQSTWRICLTVLWTIQSVMVKLHQSLTNLGRGRGGPWMDPLNSAFWLIWSNCQTHFLGWKYRRPSLLEWSTGLSQVTGSFIWLFQTPNQDMSFVLTRPYSLL